MNVSRRTGLFAGGTASARTMEKPLKMIINIWVALFVVVFAVDGAVPKFEKEDRVAFIGDSITHGGSYHPNIYLFYATRFPNAPFKVYNCGISGDTAPGTNQRFKQDIEVHQPNRATIMLGMNDAWAWLFNPEEPLQSRRGGLEKAYEIYSTEMDKLVARLKGLDCDIIFIKPSIYDQTAVLKQNNLVGKNDLLGRFSSYIDLLAEEVDGTVVDFRTPMMAVNEKLQAADPCATVVGADRVHPKAPGQFVMSHAFLKAQEMPSVVSAIVIDGTAGTVLKQANCSVRDVTVSSNGISFSCMENALPFPVSGEQKVALQWVPFQQELNQQLLQVPHLQPGTYELKIDDQSIGSWTAKELAGGINLSDNHQTPQHAQALEVKAVNDQRGLVVDKLRALMHVRHTMIRQLDPPVDESNLQELIPVLNGHVEKSKGKSWYGYLNGQVEKYIEHIDREQEYLEECETLMNEMWTVNQPRRHRWELEILN